MYKYMKTSLLRRLQAQTLPDDTPPIGKIHPFSKLAITCEPLMGLWCPSGFRKFLNQWINESVTEVFVEQPLASPGSAKKIWSWLVEGMLSTGLPCPVQKWDDGPFTCGSKPQVLFSWPEIALGGGCKKPSMWWVGGQWVREASQASLRRKKWSLLNGRQVYTLGTVVGQADLSQDI